MNTLTQLDDAVFIQDEQVKTTSLKVAELFGKQHKNVLQKLECLDCSHEFTELNFQLSEYLDSTGRKLPMYEMTKDGFIFLVMGFTGAAAAKIKEAYINTFNQMLAILYNDEETRQQIHEGAVVQLKSGGPLYTVSQIFYDQNGYMQNVEVMWHNKTNLCREILPINCLTLESKSLIQNKMLDDFWAALHNYGFDKLNHSRNPSIFALNLMQIYQCMEGLPPRNQLSAILMHSRNPYPTYMHHNHPVHSTITQKTVKCWIFDTKQKPIALIGTS